MRLGKTLKFSRLSWENNPYFPWLLKLFQGHCGVWGTAVLAPAAEAEGHCEERLGLPRAGHSRLQMAHCTHHRPQLSPQLRWGQNALGIPLGNVFKIVQNHCPALRSGGGGSEKQPCAHQRERRRRGRRSPRGWSRFPGSPWWGPWSRRFPCSLWRSPC